MKFDIGRLKAAKRRLEKRKLTVINEDNKDKYFKFIQNCVRWNK